MYVYISEICFQNMPAFDLTSVSKQTLLSSKITNQKQTRHAKYEQMFCCLRHWHSRPQNRTPSRLPVDRSHVEPSYSKTLNEHCFSYLYICLPVCQSMSDKTRNVTNYKWNEFHHLLAFSVYMFMCIRIARVTKAKRLRNNVKKFLLLHQKLIKTWKHMNVRVSPRFQFLCMCLSFSLLLARFLGVQFLDGKSTIEKERDFPKLVLVHNICPLYESKKRHQGKVRGVQHNYSCF